MLIETAYREYAKAMVEAMIRFSGDEQTARDAVAQAFAKALVNKWLEQIAEGAMKAWLYAAARNTVIDMKRREQRFRPFPIEELVEMRGSDDTDRLLTQDLMAKLPPNLREPLRLKYFERMNATEIGKELKLCPATARTRIRTALQLLRCIALGRA